MTYSHGFTLQNYKLNVSRTINAIAKYGIASVFIAARTVFAYMDVEGTTANHVVGKIFVSTTSIAGPAQSAGILGKEGLIFASTGAENQFAKNACRILLP